jgi:hypothetical protein
LILGLRLLILGLRLLRNLRDRLLVHIRRHVDRLSRVLQHVILVKFDPKGEMNRQEESKTSGRQRSAVLINDLLAGSFALFGDGSNAGTESGDSDEDKDEIADETNSGTSRSHIGNKEAVKANHSQKTDENEGDVAAVSRLDLGHERGTGDLDFSNNLSDFFNASSAVSIARIVEAGIKLLVRGV